MITRQAFTFRGFAIPGKQALSRLLRQGIHPNHISRERLGAIPIFRIEVMDKLVAVGFLIIARHSLRHHLHQLLLTHHTRSSSAHDGKQGGVSGPHGVNIHPLQSRRFLKQVEGYQILLTGRTCF